MPCGSPWRGGGQVGQLLEQLSPQGLHAIFERFRGILHEGANISKRVQYTIEVGRWVGARGRMDEWVEGVRESRWVGGGLSSAALRVPTVGGREGRVGGSGWDMGGARASRGPALVTQTMCRSRTR